MRLLIFLIFLSSCSVNKQIVNNYNILLKKEYPNYNLTAVNRKTVLNELNGGYELLLVIKTNKNKLNSVVLLDNHHCIHDFLIDGLSSKNDSILYLKNKNNY